MGKINKRQPHRHSNHHDQPARASKVVVRRHHSQTGLGKGKPGQIKHNRTGVHNHPAAKLNIPFSRSDQVLLVGEGDFSFALSLICNHPVTNLVATCFDSKDTLHQKYPNVARTTRQLSSDEVRATEAQAGGHLESRDATDVADEWNGFSPSVQSDEEDREESATTSAAKHLGNTTVLYGIDATKLSTLHKKALKPYAPFTKIVFNFPHVGGLSTDVNRQVRSNQQLLVDFFTSAKPLLATASAPAKPRPNDTVEDDFEYDSGADTEDPENDKHGQILVTIFEGEPYTLWNIRDLARHSGLKVLESFKFPWAAYPGYQHARTIGDISRGKDRPEDGKRKGAWRGEERDARCYILTLKDDDGGRPAPGSRKRKKDENDND